MKNHKSTLWVLIDGATLGTLVGTTIVLIVYFIAAILLSISISILYLLFIIPCLIAGYIGYGLRKISQDEQIKSSKFKSRKNKL